MTTKETFIRNGKYGVMSRVEVNHIKAKTQAIKHANILNWIIVLSSIIFGLIITIIGLGLFLKNSDNNNYLYLLVAGIFLMTLSKPSIEKILNKVNI